LPFNYYQFHYVQNLSSSEALGQSVGQMARWNGLVHLWFLYYLIIFYMFSLAISWSAKKMGVVATEKWKQRMETVGPVKIVLVAIVLFLLLFAYKTGIPPVNTSIRPDPLYILYYGLFYGCGWLLQINMKSISSLAKYGWVLFVIGTGLSVLYFFKEHELSAVVKSLVAAFQTVSLVTGFTGLFMKYFTRESSLWRYFSDAAYWVYLIHIAIVVSCQVLLLESPVPGSLRLPLVLLTTFAISLFTYHYLVRYTIIGEYLHGKRVRNKKTEQRPTVVA
jgi:glucan biosynthesis protein C